MATTVHGQRRAIVERLAENLPDWHEGTISLIDGSELKGSVRFDDNVGILTYQNGDVSKTLVAKSVTAFNFYDEETGDHRFFFSMEYDDGVGIPKFFFFEILRQFERFAVLSKTDPIHVEVQTHSSPLLMDAYGNMMPGPPMHYSTSELQQTETIFIIDDQGSISPFVKVLDRQSVDGLISRKRTRNKFVNKELLSQYTESHQAMLEVYADDNDLNFKIKSDLLKILDYYRSLLESQ